MFTPPRCPNRACPEHVSPTSGFFARRGFYHPLCRSKPVPRFRCKTCGRGFSRQTFRADYRDHKPDRNLPLFYAVTSGVGLRQTARIIGLTRRNTELKFRKLARHARRFQLNLRTELPDDARLQFDELETYEGRRNTRPLTVPILIEAASRYVVWAESAPIRPSGRMTDKRRAAIAQDEGKYGPRQNLSVPAIERTLQRGAEISGSLEKVHLATDEKQNYPRLAKQAFGTARLVHTRTSSKLTRDTKNPLFPINSTEAMVRDHLGRLRRDSWLASKRRRYLDLGLALWMVNRNFVRRRFNTTLESAAQFLGFVRRRLTPGEVFSWRQDWGKRSIHPLAWNHASIEEWIAGSRAGRAA